MSEKSKTILLIDDDRIHLESTRDILEDEGYEVHTHDKPFGTTNLVRDLAPDMVLLDVNMPGLSGDKLAEVLLANASTRNSKLILYSSNDEDLLRQRVSELGLSGYICKGDTLALRRRVSDYLAVS